MITREVIYRFLQGEQSERLRHIAVLNGTRHRVTRAIQRLHRDFDQPIGVEELAEQLGMSESSFYDYFKAVTDVAPLRFQKQLRLQEARRLMLGEDLNASAAGYQVGDDDPSHFSRDYKKRFGRPPKRNAEQLRAAAGESECEVAR